MAWSNEIPGAAMVGERAERAWRTPLGMVSPLWAVFGAATSVGVAYWWMTRWAQAVNIEALAEPGATPVAAAAPIEIIAEPVEAPSEALVEAVPETAEPLLEAAPAPEPALVAVAEVMESIAPPEPEPEAVAPAGPDDLTVMNGIGPKLSVALAERGVTRFAQIAAWTAEDLAEVDAALSLKGRAVREAWVAQAKRLAG